MLSLVLLLGACSGLDVHQTESAAGHLSMPDSGEITRCTRLFAELDRVVDLWGVRDARATRLTGIPTSAAASGLPPMANT